MTLRRLMTWNVRRDDGEGDWPARTARLVAHIRAQRPDALGLQETLPHQMRDLCAALPEYACVEGLPTPRHEHNPILLRRDAFALEDAGTLWLSRSGRPERDWGADQARMATWAQVRDVETSAHLTLVCTHFDAKSPRFREEAARLLRERFAGAILLGDFNAEPESEPHDILREGRIDPAPAVGLETMHGGDDYADARYDWILVPDRMRAKAARAGDVDASDHYALVADVEPRRVDRD